MRPRCDLCGYLHQPGRTRTCRDVEDLPLLSECVEIDLDLETTGRDAAEDRPWQIHADGRTWVCNPGREIDAGAREVCGVDDARLAVIEASPPWADIAPEVLTACESGHLVVAYNGVTYDGPLLRASLDAVGIDPSGLPPILDPKIWAFELWPNLPNHKLSTVHEHVGGTMDGVTAHDAGGDCLMMRRIWDTIRDERRLESRTLRSVLAFQEKAKALQTSDWAKYGGKTPDGAIFMWIRTCRRCMGVGRVEVPAPNGDCEDPITCSACMGVGAMNHTQKRRGQPIESGYARWALSKVNDLPEGVREVFGRVAR